MSLTGAAAQGAVMGASRKSAGGSGRHAYSTTFGIVIQRHKQESEARSGHAEAIAAKAPRRLALVLFIGMGWLARIASTPTLNPCCSRSAIFSG